ncbi:MAG: endonuclease [Dehalococcoidia bacterium]|nr:MAG: endonuclease [Dehalococcoidia bacterium]
MESHRISGLLEDIYRRLSDTYGLQLWWPADEPFEVMVGAILTQSVAWSNVEKAIVGLKAAKALSPQVMRRITTIELARIIYPCGYFNAKAIRLKALADWLGSQYKDNIGALSAVDFDSLRQQLLSIHGIGPETADSIMLYAINRSAFVIDAYTRRIIYRIGLAPERGSYDGYQRLFTDNLAVDVELFNEYHALLVKLAKDACRKKPLCGRCCLTDICWFYKGELS